jgi:hypothetical protein
MKTKIYGVFESGNAKSAIKKLLIHHCIYVTFRRYCPPKVPKSHQIMLLYFLLSISCCLNLFIYFLVITYFLIYFVTELEGVRTSSTAPSVVSYYCIAILTT